MAASIDDKFSKNYNNNNPRTARVVATRIAEATELQCDSLAGWSSDTVVHYATTSLDDDGNPDLSKMSTWAAVVSGDTLTQMTRTGGAPDEGNGIGDIVKALFTGKNLSDIVDGILVTHNQDGSLKENKAAENVNAGTTLIASSKLDFTSLVNGILVNNSGTAAVATPSAAVIDANGWSVITYGPITVAQKTKTFTVPSTGQGVTNFASISGNNAPSTLSAGSFVISFSEVIGSTGAAGNFKFNHEAAHSSALNIMTGNIVATKVSSGTSDLTTGRCFQLVAYI